VTTPDLDDSADRSSASPVSSSSMSSSSSVSSSGSSSESSPSPGLVARLQASWSILEAAAIRLRDRARRHPVLGELVEVIEGVFIDYGRDHGAMYAGALTFYAILSLIPLTVLLASVFGFLMSSGGEDDIMRALREVVRQLRKVLPYLQPSFADDLRTIVEYRSRLGVVGFVAMLWAASEVFRGVEFACARIFARLGDHQSPDHRKTQARSFLTTKLLFGVTATAVMVAGLLIRLMGTILGAFIDALELPGWATSILGSSLDDDTSVLGAVATAATLIIGFMIVIRVFSPHRVMLRFALMGGGLFFIFFQGAHAIYDVYLSRITNVSAMYGSFATLIVLILWIYYCAVLLLVCCHAVKVAQRRYTLGPRWPKDGTLFGALVPSASSDGMPDAGPADDQ
jgi:YihY family inner membrane protein